MFRDQVNSAEQMEHVIGFGHSIPKFEASAQEDIRHAVKRPLLASASALTGFQHREKNSLVGVCSLVVVHSVLTASDVPACYPSHVY